MKYGNVFLISIIILCLVLTVIPYNTNAKGLEIDGMNDELIFTVNKKVSLTETVTCFDVIQIGTEFYYFANDASKHLHMGSGDSAIGICSNMTEIDNSGSMYNNFQIFNMNYGGGISSSSAIIIYNQNGYLFAGHIKNMNSVENKTLLTGGGAVTYALTSKGYGDYHQAGFGYIFYLAVLYSSGSTQVYALKFLKVGNAVTFTLSTNYYGAGTSNERVLLYGNRLINSSANPAGKSPYMYTLGYANSTNQIQVSGPTIISGWNGFTVCKIDAGTVFQGGFNSMWLAILANTSDFCTIGVYSGGTGYVITGMNLGYADTINDYCYGIDMKSDYAMISLQRSVVYGASKNVAVLKFNSTTDLYTASYNNTITDFGYSECWIYYGVGNVIYIKTNALYFMTTYTDSSDDDPYINIIQEINIGLGEFDTNITVIDEILILIGNAREGDFSSQFLGLIWLLVTFLPAIVINECIPRIGFVAGILIMTIALGLTMENYFFITIVALIGCAFLVLRGD
jgi:hypothetical protein